MSHTIVLLPTAEKAINRAANWYDRRNPRAARAFLAAIDAALNKIAENPYQFSQVRRNVYRAIVVGFPYNILFKMRETEAVIARCLHFRRNPNRWPPG